MHSVGYAVLRVREHAHAKPAAGRVSGQDIAVAAFFDLNGEPVEPEGFSKRRRKADVDVIGDGIVSHANTGVNVGLSHVGAEQIGIIA